jgi:hypothetical protein
MRATVFAALLAFPAWGQEYPESQWPYTCLPAVDADAVHAARGDDLVAYRNDGNTVLFLWQKAEGGFFIVQFSRVTLEACIVKETEYDPRDSVSG